MTQHAIQLYLSAAAAAVKEGRHQDAVTEENFVAEAE